MTTRVDKMPLETDIHNTMHYRCKSDTLPACLAQKVFMNVVLRETIRSFIPGYNAIKIIDVQDKILWRLPQGFDSQDRSVSTLWGFTRQPVLRPPGRSCWIDVFTNVLYQSIPQSTATLSDTAKAVASFRSRLSTDPFATKVAGCARSVLRQISTVSSDLGIPRQGDKIDVQTMLYSNALALSKYNDQERLFLTNFCCQNKVESLEKYEKQQIEAEGLVTYSKLFKQLGINPLEGLPIRVMEELLDSQNLDVQQIENLSDVPVSLQYQIVNITAKIAIAKAYQLRPAKWTPLAGIDCLMAEIRSDGAMGIAGYFGNRFYTKPAHVVMKIKGCEIYGWNPTDRKTNYFVGHYIAVVGVVKEKNVERLRAGKVGYVIYVNSTDGSAPADPSVQKFYMTSYDAFCRHVNDEFGRMMDPEHLPRQPVVYSYGLLRNDINQDRKV